VNTVGAKATPAHAATGLLTSKEQATEVSRYYLTFVDCPLAFS
jgi:hypothetical protein